MELKTALLPWQANAVEKLKKLKIGALYMEMGTGKTRTALELIKLRLDDDKIDGVIWLCPCSVKANLLADIRKHSDLADIPGMLEICGIESLSAGVKANVKLLELVKAKRIFLIVDESTLVKNHAALRSIHITQIAENCKYKLILNGTPITKFEADLYSQWYILDKRILGYNSFWSFSKNHLEYDEQHPERIRRTLNVDYLTEKIEPYTFQCLKADCFSLPPKVSKTEYFSMTDEQDDNYNYVIEKLLTDLDEMEPESVYRFFGALQAVTSGFAIRVDNDLSTSRFDMFLSPYDNPRIMLLLDLVSRNDDKTIIFCTYTSEIIKIVDMLNELSPGSAVAFYGEIPQKKRQAQIDEFTASARFLVANKTCGAYGLNLQFCHRIIYYSHDWDWGTRAQSEDRVHRYGQEQEVQIFDICANSSIDIKILECLSNKESLVNHFKREINAQSKKSLLNFARGK
ncbi:MAG: DEAD/DEAH box helicase [Oscillospiraceae bacterium]